MVWFEPQSNLSPGHRQAPCFSRPPDGESSAPPACHVIPPTEEREMALGRVPSYYYVYTAVAKLHPSGYASSPLSRPPPLASHEGYRGRPGILVIALHGQSAIGASHQLLVESQTKHARRGPGMKYLASRLFRPRPSPPVPIFVIMSKITRFVLDVPRRHCGRQPRHSSSGRLGSRWTSPTSPELPPATPTRPLPPPPPPPPALPQTGDLRSGRR